MEKEALKHVQYVTCGSLVQVHVQRQSAQAGTLGDWGWDGEGGGGGFE